MGKTQQSKHHGYHLKIPMVLYEQLDWLAKSESTSVREVIIKSIKLGLWYFAKKKQNPDSQFQMVDPDGKITEVELL
jgi:hypothetical protein